MQVTIAKAALAGYRIVPAPSWKRFWHLYTPEGNWVGNLYNSPYEAAKYAVDRIEHDG